MEEVIGTIMEARGIILDIVAMIVVMIVALIVVIMIMIVQVHGGIRIGLVVIGIQVHHGTLVLLGILTGEVVGIQIGKII